MCPSSCTKAVPRDTLKATRAPLAGPAAVMMPGTDVWAICGFNRMVIVLGSGPVEKGSVAAPPADDRLSLVMLSSMRLLVFIAEPIRLTLEWSDFVRTAPPAQLHRPPAQLVSLSTAEIPADTSLSHH